ncbi:MAG: phosphotransferase family protein [Candidatus Bilamarchaeum sp.]
MAEKYSDSDQYQEEVAAQYKERVVKFDSQEVVNALDELGFKIPIVDLQEASAGNVNATYLTPELVVKLNQDQSSHSYLANKIVSDKLGNTAPVVKVLVYDYFDKTPFEALVMERAKGKMFLETIFDMPEEERKSIFRQALRVVKQLHNIPFENFGEINSEQSFPTYTEFLNQQFSENLKVIREQNLVSEDHIDRIEKYVNQNIALFDNEQAVFVHTDLHMGNIIHEADKVTAVIDFDSALKAPKYRTLISLLGFIDNPSQFVEGTKDFNQYKGKNFYELYPVLKEELNDVFEDKQLLKKLNVLGVINGAYWMAQNWSESWNKEMANNLVNEEIANTPEQLDQSYYGKIFNHD